MSSPESEGLDSSRRAGTGMTEEVLDAMHRGFLGKPL
jgi:hypothetical protein